MIKSARYAHTNLIARDWRALSSFYIRVFGCTVVPPERNYSGADLDAGAALQGTWVQGVHLRLPGGGPGGPTLEIYSYRVMEEASPAPANRVGFTHIAFEVPDVAAAREEVLREGGTIVGDIVTLQTTTGAKVTWCYLRDPEGNMLELQSWG